MGPGHYEIIELGELGSQADIPYLLFALGRQTNREDCTYDHCIESLEKLTRAKAGRDYSDWTNWWVREMRRPVPDWHPSYGLVAWKKSPQGTTMN